MDAGDALRLDPLHPSPPPLLTREPRCTHARTRCDPAPSRRVRGRRADSLHNHQSCTCAGPEALHIESVLACLTRNRCLVDNSLIRLRPSCSVNRSTRSVRRSSQPMLAIPCGPLMSDMQPAWYRSRGVDDCAFDGMYHVANRPRNPLRCSGRFLPA